MSSQSSIIVASNTAVVTPAGNAGKLALGLRATTRAMNLHRTCVPAAKAVVTLP